MSSGTENTYKFYSVRPAALPSVRPVAFPVLLLGVLAFCLGYAVIPAVIALIASGSSTAVSTAGICGPFSSLLLLFLLMNLYTGSTRKTMLQLGFRRFPYKVLLYGLPLSAAIMLCGGAVTLLWGYIGAVLKVDLGTPPTIEAAMSENIPDVIALLTAALLAAPVLEEIFFRRIIYSTLLRWLPPAGAALTASLAFSALHMSLLQLPGLLLIGMVWQNLFLRSRTLWTSVILHFFNNLIAAVMLLLMRFTECTNI